MRDAIGAFRPTVRWLDDRPSLTDQDRMAGELGRYIISEVSGSHKSLDHRSGMTKKGPFGTARRHGSVEWPFRCALFRLGELG